MKYFDQAVDWLKEVWCSGKTGSDDFYKGVLIAVAALIVLWLLLRILKLVFKLCRKYRRCSGVTLEQEGGNITISVNAVAAAVRAELASFRQLEVRRVLLYRKKQEYAVTIRATYHAESNDEGVGNLAERLKPQLAANLKKLLGVDNITEINLLVEHFEPVDKDDDSDQILRPGTPVLPIAMEKPVSFQ